MRYWINQPIIAFWAGNILILFLELEKIVLFYSYSELTALRLFVGKIREKSQ